MTSNVDLVKLFSTVAETLVENQADLNKADEYNQNHGDHMVDIPFPKPVRNDVIAAGRAEPHHLLSETGWVSFYIRQPADVEHAIALLQRSFELAVQQRNKRSR